MCRLLYVRSEEPFAVAPYLERFADMCKVSPEYQGHGWGLATLQQGNWELQHSIEPIWDDQLPTIKQTKSLIVHARSAFRDEGICVENNMPFIKDGVIFAFNGELQGVRIKEEGRIGAEKIFNFLLARHEGDWIKTIAEGTRAILSRSRRVRAMNFFIADTEHAYCYSCFDENPEYFTLHVSYGPQVVLCSQPLSNQQNWEPAPINQAFGI